MAAWVSDLRRWAAVRAEALRRDGWRCTRCGKAGRLEVHHIRPVVRGGAHYDLENLASVCRDCHRFLHRRVRDDEWAALIAEAL